MKKALGISRELIPITTTTTTRVAFWDPPSGSKNLSLMGLNPLRRRLYECCLLSSSVYAHLRAASETMMKGLGCQCRTAFCPARKSGVWMGEETKITFAVAFYVQSYPLQSEFITYLFNWWQLLQNSFYLTIHYTVPSIVTVLMRMQVADAFTVCCVTCVGCVVYIRSQVLLFFFVSIRSCVLYSALWCF